MPSPGAGSVTSLSYMAQFLRSKSNSPSQGYSAGAEQRDVTQYNTSVSTRSGEESSPKQRPLASVWTSAKFRRGNVESRSARASL